MEKKSLPKSFHVCGLSYVFWWFYICENIGFIFVGKFYVCGWFTFVGVISHYNTPLPISVNIDKFISKISTNFTEIHSRWFHCKPYDVTILAAGQQFVSEQQTEKDRLSHLYR